MRFGKLDFVPVKEKPDLAAEPTMKAIVTLDLKDIWIAEIDPSLSDTAAFCEQYDVSMDSSVNCVIVEGKRGENKTYAAVLIGGSRRADINGVVRKAMDAKKISFAPKELAVEMSGMEFGAINPIGLPADWMIFVDTEVSKLDLGIIGSGIRKSKLLVSGQLLASLPNAQVLELAK